MSLNIYFAGPIRGGRDDAENCHRIIVLLNRYGDVLTEHVGDVDLTSDGENDLTDEQIYERDMDWIDEADCLVAEVSSPSHGVGYEIRSAEYADMPVLCLRRSDAPGRLSAMLTGNPNTQVSEYGGPEELEKAVESFMKEIISISSDTD